MKTLPQLRCPGKGTLYIAQIEPSPRHAGWGWVQTKMILRRTQPISIKDKKSWPKLAWTIKVQAPLYVV